MLVLSRKREETIRCTLPDGRALDLTIVDVRGDRVRVGITAPEDVAVHRLEVHDAIARGNGGLVLPGPVAVRSAAV